MPSLNNTEINDICTEWENDPKASATIRMIAASLRELVRRREGMPKRKRLQTAYRRETRLENYRIDGWNACAEAMEKAVKDDQRDEAAS